MTLRYLPKQQLFYFFFAIIYSTGVYVDWDTPGLPTHSPIGRQVQKIQARRPLQLLDTGGALWRLRSQTGCRSYIGWYGKYFQGTLPGCPFVSPDRSSMAWTAFTRRHCNCSDVRPAPGDYTLVPSTSATAGVTS